MDLFFLLPLVIGTIWWIKAPEGKWKAVASRFTKVWGFSLLGMMAGAINGGITMPNGPDTSASIYVVGLIWLVSIVTMLWIAIRTLIVVLAMRNDTN